MANAWLLKPLDFTATSPHTALGDAAYTGNDYAGVMWRSTSIAYPVLKLDLGADIAIDSVMLFGLKSASQASLAGSAATAGRPGCGARVVAPDSRRGRGVDRSRVGA